MIDENRSTLEFRSNLQPITNGWEAVKSAVHDSFALEQLQKTGARLTELQEREYRNASLHCTHAFPDDYPWGTVLMPDGRKKIACKCLRTDCSGFKTCRPDFNESELLIFEENKANLGKAIDFSEHMHEYSKAVEYEAMTTDDTPVIASVHDAAVPEIPEIVIPDLNEIEETATPTATPIPAMEEVTPKGFGSFVKVSQQTIIEADINSRSIINAGPGTGKTWTLIEKLIHLANQDTVDSSEITVLCFSRAAVEVVEQRLHSAFLEDRIGYTYNNIDIRTFDSFCTSMIYWTMTNCPEILRDDYHIEFEDYDARIATAIRILTKKPDIMSQYGHVIVDEVQDLVGCRAEMVLRLLDTLPAECGFTLLGDACQAIYDWQSVATPGIMSSDTFYKKIFEKWPDINYWTFTDNHRQTNALSGLAAPYRNAILTGSSKERNDIVSQILSKINDSGINMMSADNESFQPYKNIGTIGILTRTNAQSLKISELLRNNDIEHTLQRPASDVRINEWVSKVFCSYPNDTVNFEAFSEAFSKIYPKKTSEETEMAWTAIISTQYNTDSSRYEVEKLLEGILRNGRNKELFVSDNTDSPITISNIHRAKGREFDSVLVLKDVLEPQENSTEELLEHKVKYVAITRPRKHLYKLNMKQQFIYRDKGLGRRCFQAGGFRPRKYLSHIEIGLPGDINRDSFAETVKRQEYIQTMLKPGMRLKLIKCPKSTKENWFKYKMVLEDNENIVLGYTDQSFAYGLESAIQRILNLSPSVRVYDDIYPNMLSDVYVESLTTCISANKPALKGARTYGNISIWTGYALSGFAHCERDIY